MTYRFGRLLLAFAFVGMIASGSRGTEPTSAKEATPKTKPVTREEAAARTIEKAKALLKQLANPKLKPTRMEMVAMHDGVELATDLYLPTKGTPPFPTLYAATPYGKLGGRDYAKVFTEKGYAFVCQDMRGRFQSKGEDAIIFQHNGWGEQRDGQETIEWIVRQPWSNGIVGMIGGSALGITQNMTAPHAPDNFRAQVVEVAFSNMYRQCTFQGGVWRKELMEGWLAATNLSKRNIETFFAHPNEDSFWEGLNPEAQAEGVNTPGIFVGGWYDIFLQGSIHSFVTIQSHGGLRARGNCRLILGPWAHGTFEELKYPENSGRHHVPAADALRFYDHWLKGADNGVDKDLPVHYYVMGDTTDPKAPGNQWRAAEHWPPPADQTPIYCHADGTLSWEAPTEEKAERSYRYDPRDPVPTVGGQNLLLPKGPMDQRKVEDRPDVLLFTTDTLTEPLEITGPIVAKLFVTSDAPDTDFTVKLTDIYPDGRSMLVTDGILRARHRVSLAREDFMKPGEIYEIHVDLWSTSLVLNAGHRLRIAISSSNHPRFDPNPNTGRPFRADKETRIANNTILLSKQHPSSVLLPVCRSETADQPKP
ncbi:MAG: CocE/NonD family hydrolase [Planctomycetota bacterium]